MIYVLNANKIWENLMIWKFEVLGVKLVARKSYVNITMVLLRVEVSSQDGILNGVYTLFGPCKEWFGLEYVRYLNVRIAEHGWVSPRTKKKVLCKNSSMVVIWQPFGTLWCFWHSCPWNFLICYFTGWRQTLGHWWRS